MKMEKSSTTLIHQMMFRMLIRRHLLVAYIQHHIESNYKFTYWEIELEEKKVLVIYGGMLKAMRY